MSKAPNPRSIWKTLSQIKFNQGDLSELFNQMSQKEHSKIVA